MYIQTKGKTIDGIWYGVPRTLESSVKKLHQELFDDNDYYPSSSHSTPQ